MMLTLRFILLLFLIWFLSACYVRKEGCLDTLASNYELTADDACLDCCTYPNLTLNFKHMAGDSIFSPDSTYTNDLNETFKLLDVRFYLSSFTLTQKDPSLTKYQVLKTIVTNEDIVIPDDIKIIRSIDRSMIIGNIKSFGTYDTISFDFGLNPFIQNATFDSLPSSHVLSPNIKLKDDTGKLAHVSIRYLTSESDSIKSLNIALTQTHNSFVVGYLNKNIKGQAIIYPITLDYLALFKNVDLKLSQAEIEVKVAQNIRNFIFVK